MPNTPFRTAQTTAILTAVLLLTAPASAQQDVGLGRGGHHGPRLRRGPQLLVIRGQQATSAEDDDIRTLVSRLSLEQYKATLEGLTQFGDRRQGTKRNRDAID